MASTLLNRNYTAGAAIAAFRIVKPGAADGEVVQAAAAAGLNPFDFRAWVSRGPGGEEPAGLGVLIPLI